MQGYLVPKLVPRLLWKSMFNSKVEIWCNKLNRLSDIAKCHPQAAYAAFVHGYKHKFTYCIRTIPDISRLLKPVEEAIANVFLPALFGQEISHIDRQIWALPTRLGGLGILCIPNEAEFNLSSSKVISMHLCALIVKQSISGLPSAEALSHATLTVLNDGRERLHGASLSLNHHLSADQCSQRCFWMGSMLYLCRMKDLLWTKRNFKLLWP